MDNNDILGTRGILGENLSSGVGFVIIPPGVDLKTYKEDCFSSNTVSITGFDFGHIHNVPVDKEVMQRIEFPKRIGEMGSPVVFVNIPKHNINQINLFQKVNNEHVTGREGTDWKNENKTIQFGNRHQCIASRGISGTA
jgi:hypothetical protein